MKMPGLSVSFLGVIFLCSFFAGGSPGHTANAATAVELIGPSELSPGSTLEFRFAQPMVAPDRLGPGEQSPVVFDPPLEGAFVWLSTRSGVFLPTEKLPLARSWAVGLRPGLVDAAGASVSGAGILARVTTPQFAATFSQTGVWDPDDVSSMVQPRVAFNASVNLETVRGEFRSGNGLVVPAEVRFATERDYFPGGANVEIWEGETGAATTQETGADGSENVEFLNRLVFTPETPLPPADGWRFELGAGVKSVSGLVAEEGALVLDLGKVRSLELVSLNPQNLVLSGPMVNLGFNMPLAPDITSETAEQFFTIEPAPGDLRWTVDWNGVMARGSFEVGVPHTVRVGAGVVGIDGRPYGGAREKSFTVGPVPPRLYLPTITGQQLRFGKREFPVRWVNVMGLEIEAVRIKPADLPAARQAMKAYFKSGWDEAAPDELYQPVDTALIRGERLKVPPLALRASAQDQASEAELPWDRILGDKSPGAVFLTVKGQPFPDIGGSSPGAQALVQLTDLGILWKHAVGGLQVRVFSMQTGEMLPGVRVSLWGEKEIPVEAGGGEGEMEKPRELVEIAAMETSSEGIAQFPPGKMPLWLLAQNGDDAEILPMGYDATTLPMWNFRVPVEFASWEPAQGAAGEGWRGMIFTDRPLYQAGETVQVRGYLRRILGSAVTLPVATPVRVALFGPNGEEVEAREVAVEADGDIRAEFTAPLSPRGEYRIAFSPGEDRFPWWSGVADTKLVVADYQPDAFEVRAAFGAQATAEGLPLVEIAASYFFGGALGKSPVRWTLQSMAAEFAPQGFEGFQFLARPGEATAVRTLTGESVLPAGGEALRLELPAEEPAAFPRSEVVTVEVTDVNQQTVATMVERRIEAADFYLGIAPVSAGLPRAGEEIAVRAVAVRPDGQPVAEPVDFKAELFWRRPDVLRVQGAGQAVSFQTTITEVSVGEASGRTVNPVRRGEQWSVADSAPLAMKVPKPGSYLLRIETKDGAGRPVVTEQYLYVTGEEETVWDSRNPYEIDLVPEKSEYAPGDTARILVKNPLPGPAVVFIERGQNILRSWNVHLEGNAPVIEIPLTELDAPNVFVSVVILRGAEKSERKYPMPEFRHGVCQLRIQNAADELQVGIGTNAEAFEPGEVIRATVTVRGHEGTPVAGAGVTVWAVDDGILALTGYERPDALGVFRAPLPLGVRTGISLVHLLPENPDELQFANKGYLIGGGGLDGAGLRFRENFPGTIAWFSDLKTDQNGTVEVEFPAPDALTRYRIIAVAHEGANRFGGAEDSVAIRKPLMLLSAMGAGAHTGDQLLARAVVRNQSDSPLDVSWQFAAEGASVAGEKSGTVRVPTGESAVLETPVEFSQTGNARLLWTARAKLPGGGEIADALGVGMTVRSPMLEIRETAFPAIGAGTNDLTKDVNPQVLEGGGRVRVSIGNTRLVGLETAADSLIGYPYGCAEQTASALLPWVLPALEPVFPALRNRVAERPQVVRESLAKLLDFRSGSGGLGMWPGISQPSTFITSWASIVWARAAAAGVDAPAFPESTLDWLAQSLREEPRDSDPAAWTQRALTLFALALHGKAQPAYAETMLQRAGLLPPDARALLALALAAHKDEEGAAQRAAAAGGLLGPGPVVDGGFDPFGSANRSRALHLLALVEVLPESPAIAPAVAELLASRQQGEWGNTQANAWALLALDRYREIVEAGAATGSGAPAEGSLVGPDSTVPIALPGAGTPAVIVRDFAWPGENGGRALRVDNSQDAKWFAETRFAITPPLGIQPAQNRGFGIKRTVHKLNQDGSLAAAGNLRVGDRVLVSLELENTLPASFVAVVDPLPAIFEAINPDFRPERGGVLPAGMEYSTADFREVLSGEVRFFINTLLPGRHGFSYLARVRQAGTAIAPGTTVEEMYRPDRFGLGAAETFESREN